MIQRRAILPACLIVVSLGLSGCGAGPLRRIGLSTHPAAPRETGFQRELRETREAAALAPREPYWPYHLAEKYLGADSLARAEAAVESALALDPGYAPALALGSSLDYRAGRHERAVRELEAALARPGAFPEGVPDEILEGLALHYDALERPADADAALARLSHGKSSRPAPALVYLTLRGDDPESAAPAAATLLGAHPESAANQNNYGITRLRKADVDGAQRAFERAIELAPDRAGPYYNLAILHKYYRLDEEEAARWFTQYWERSQKDPDGLAVIFGKAEKKSLAQDGD